MVYQWPRQCRTEPSPDWLDKASSSPTFVGYKTLPEGGERFVHLAATHWRMCVSVRLLNCITVVVKFGIDSNILMDHHIWITLTTWLLIMRLDIFGLTVFTNRIKEINWILYLYYL